MKAMVRPMGSVLPRLFLLSLTVIMSTVLQAQPAEDARPVKALATNSSGALLVLRSSGLFSLEDRTATEVPLPPSDSGAQPVSLARGADASIYLASPGLGIWRYNSAIEGWQSLHDHLPDLGVTAIAAHATQPETLYAYLGKDGMFRSRNGDAEWTKVDSGPREPVFPRTHPRNSGRSFPFPGHRARCNRLLS